MVNQKLLRLRREPFEDIPKEPVSFAFTPSELYVPGDTATTEEEKVGGESKIYFVRKELMKECDDGKFRRPRFWYDLPKNKDNKLRQAFEGDVINTNCRYDLNGWRNAYEGNQDGMTVTKDAQIRGNPTDWFRVIHPSGSPIPRADPLLDVGGSKVPYPDGKEYTEARVKAILGKEVYQMACSQIDSARPTLPTGTFLVGYGHPLHRMHLYVNNEEREMSPANMDPFLGLVREELLNEGDVETLQYTPVTATLQVYIYMKQLCGAPFLFKRVNVKFRFTEPIIVKRATADDTIVRGTLEEMRARIPFYNDVIMKAQALIPGFVDDGEAQIRKVNDNFDKMAGNVKKVNDVMLNLIDHITRYPYIIANGLMSHQSYQGLLRTRQTLREIVSAWESKTMSDLTTTTDNQKVQITRTTNLLVGAEQDRINVHNAHINRIREIDNSSGTALRTGIARMLRDGKVEITSLDPSPDYRDMEDLYSAEDIDNNGRLVPDTERIYVKI